MIDKFPIIGGIKDKKNDKLCKIMIDLIII